MAENPDALGELGTPVAARPRYGILVIDKDPVPEIEFRAMAPFPVSVHAARFRSPRSAGSGSYGADPARRIVEADDVSDGLAHLGGMDAQAIAMCFVTASFFGGRDFDQSFADLARQRSGVEHVVTSAQAVREALHALGARHPYLIAPPWFNDLIAKHALDYFTESGLRPAGLSRYQLPGSWQELEPWQVWDGNGQLEANPQDLIEQVRRTIPSGADAVAVIGNGLLAGAAVEPLESHLGVPVTTSNQAALWWSLHATGRSAGPQYAGHLGCCRNGAEPKRDAV